MLDILHTLDLGVTARLAAVSIVRLLETGKLGTPRTRQGYVSGLRILNRSMKAFVSSMSKQYRVKVKGPYSCFSKVTLGMLGLSTNLSAKPLLKGKGVEVRHVLPFCIEQFRRHAGSIEHGRELLVAMHSLQQAYELIAESCYCLDEDTCNDLAHKLQRCAVNARDAACPLLPKFHTLPHLAEQARTAGNLRHAATLEDESFNADNVRIAASCHTAQFVERVHAKQQLLMRLEIEVQNLQVEFEL